MEFNSSLLDKQKRNEFHTKEFIQCQMKVKNIAHADLIKALDELAEVANQNAGRINKLDEIISEVISDEFMKLYQEAKTRYENLSVLAIKISEIYLMVLDIYTYGTYGMLANSEWDWRAFARHFYTMLFEHIKTINTYLNTIIKILKQGIDDVYDVETVNQVKKDFSSFINHNSEYAKHIRVNVDAHFDGDYIERLDLIKSLSYSDFIALYFEYISKMEAFLKALKPALEKLRLSADVSYHTLVAFSIQKSNK